MSTICLKFTKNEMKVIDDICKKLNVKSQEKFLRFVTANFCNHFNEIENFRDYGTQVVYEQFVKKSELPSKPKKLLQKNSRKKTLNK